MGKGYQKVTNLPNKTNNQQLKFSTQEWLEVSDDEWEHTKQVNKLNFKPWG